MMPRWLRRWPAVLPPVLLLLFVVLPFVQLFVQGAGGLSWAFIADPYYRWRLWWSLLQALATCALSLCFGLPAAWALARYEFAGRALLLRLLMLPFVMPTLVAAIGVLTLFGPQGVSGIHLQDTPWLLLYGNLFYNLPLLVRAAIDGFSHVPQSRLFAARTLGASPWRLFWRVELPGALPWIASALCLIFLYCFTGFGLALLLGGQRYATVEVEIYSLVAYELDLANAGALALLTLCLTATAAIGYAWLERRLAQSARGAVCPRQPVDGVRARLMLGASLALIALFCLAPLVAIAVRAAAAGPAWDVLTEADTWLALGNSARFTLLALVGACVFGLAHGFFLRGGALPRALAFLPYAVSPVCVAFGLLLAYPSLAANLVMLLGAYVLLAYPFVARSLGASLDSLPPHLPQAARTLGATPLRTGVRVVWPHVAPALRRGMAFAAATALGEFAVTLFLSRPEWSTLTTLIYQRLGRAGADNLDAALVLSCVLMALSMLAFVVIEWPQGRRDHAGSE
jgi:thiamine transport system permease protein